MVFAEALKPVGNIAYIVHIRTHLLRDMGGCMSPFAAFLFLLGLETLHLRMPRHCENAQAIAEWLAGHDCVKWVNYPGLAGHPHHAAARKYLPGGCGGIVGFGIRGGREAGIRFINRVKLASHLANIGDARTLVIHPASTTHQQLSEEALVAGGISADLVRISVGLEDAEDVCADLDMALHAAQKQEG